MDQPIVPTVEAALPALTSISIHGYRGFAQEAVIELAQPNGTQGSGLTVIVGPNNSGKSTVIEALRAMTQGQGNPPTFSEGKRNKRANDRVTIKLTDNRGVTRQLETLATGGSGTTFNEDYTIPAPASIYVLPSRRTFQPFFGGSRSNRSGYIEADNRIAPTRQPPSNFSNRLIQANHEPEKREQFDMLLGRLLNPVPDWTIDENDSGQHYIKIGSGDAAHNSDGLGEGLISLLFIVDSLYDSDPGSVIAIDEPELSLHPSILRKLKTLILEYSSDRQILLSTHSPSLIDWPAIAGGAAVVRMVKREENCHVFALSEETKTRINGLIRNLNNPHVLGLDANEIFFFDDGVILLEGQEDVIFYPIALSDLDVGLPGTFFGWGVGGADNMKTIASILSDLGFRKVAGILDGNRADAVGPLKKEFPDYEFFVLPADDIRTKPARAARPDVIGLLDEGRNVRPDLRVSAHEMFSQVVSYLNS